jgi:SAM-dependent methyltransferase
VRLPVLPAGLAGVVAVELGCGSGYVSAWLARRGARPVGVDVSARQLAVAQRLQAEFGLRFPLVQADAERVPLGAGCAGLVISEYGAPVWCDPYRWIPEAARLLRPYGRLVVLAQSVLARMCIPERGPATGRLVRDLFGLDGRGHDRSSGAAQRCQQRLCRSSRRMGQTLAGRGGLVRPPLIRLIDPPSGNQPDRTSIRPAADPGVRLKMPSGVRGSGGNRVSRERRASAGGGFPVYADGE